jgi:hypothetical protein
MLNAGLAAIGRDLFFPRRPFAIGTAALLRLRLAPAVGVTLPLRRLALLPLDVPLLSPQAVAPEIFSSRETNWALSLV